MDNRLPKYAIWVALIILLIWGFYRSASGAIKYYTDVETIGGSDDPISVPMPGFTETEIRYRDKQSATNDVTITSDCCSGEQGYTAPIKNFQPPKTKLPEVGILPNIPHGWVEARQARVVQRSGSSWRRNIPSPPNRHYNNKYYIQYVAGYDKHGPVTVNAEISKSGIDRRKVINGKVYVDARTVKNYFDVLTNVTFPLAMTAFALAHHRTPRINQRGTGSSSNPMATIRAAKDAWNKEKAIW